MKKTAELARCRALLGWAGALKQEYKNACDCPSINHCKLQPPPVPRQKRQLVVTRTITKTISQCYHECPYFDLDGGPGPVMVCTHPAAPNTGYIISHPDCDDGFPELCPLTK